jgi:AGCS family alanine or glycine:cation symporter
MEERVVALADFLWRADQAGGMALLTLLVGTGVYLTIRLGLPQVRYFKHAVDLARGKYDRADDPGEVTHFQALAAALSGTVGIGNIAGVATAIYWGGPGAVLWLWVTAAVGMATKMAECTLAVKYRQTNPDGTISGGPMYSIANGMSRRFGFLAWAFALFAVLASFGIGNMVQANTVAEQVASTSASLGFAVPKWATGLVMATLLGLVIVGGIKRIARVASRLVPFMALLYVGGAVVVVVLHWRELPGALGTILDSAWNGAAATGGFVGATVAQAIRWGVARGTFSNEAGLGSSPIAHAAARTNEPIREGLVAMLEPFVDTLCICTLTALAILSTGVWHERMDTSRPAVDAVFYERAVTSPQQAAEPTNAFDGVIRVRGGEPLGAVHFFEGRGTIESPTFSVEGEPFDGALFVRAGRLTRVHAARADRGLVPADELLPRLRLEGQALTSGPTLTSAAFERAFPGGRLLVTLALILFAFSTAISWSYYGDRCIGYLFGLQAVTPYRLAFAVAHFLGALFAVRVVWAAADVANALMALPNLIALWALAPAVSLLRRRYFAKDVDGGAADDDAGSTDDETAKGPPRPPKRSRRRAK